MNADPSSAPECIPIGKLEPAKRSRKAASLAPVLMSQPYQPSATEAAAPLPNYSIPAAPLPQPRATSSLRGWRGAVLLFLVALACLGGGILLALANSGATQESLLDGVDLSAILPPDGIGPKEPLAANVGAEVEPKLSDDPPGAAKPKPIAATVQPVPVVAAKATETPARPPQWKPVLKVPGLEQKDIDEAIRRGVENLRETQQLNGTWQSGGHDVGCAALPGLTLLECGVAANDPIVKTAAAFVRTNVGNLKQTYDLSLAILFLDRLGDPKDQGLIKTMALRLVAGQHDNGGWSYDCPVLPSEESQQLLTFLLTNRPPQLQKPLPRPGKPLDSLVAGQDPKLQNPLAGHGSQLPNPLPKPDGGLRNPLAKDNANPSAVVKEKNVIQPFTPEDPSDPKKSTAEKTTPKGSGLKNGGRPDGLPPNLRNLPIVTHIGKGKGTAWRAKMRDDNSNSQFALLALWTARRHDVPTEHTLKLAQARYQKSQHGDGGWGYRVQQTGSTPSMTCVGLLGLAMGHGVSWDIVDATKPAKEDRWIQKGLDALGRSISQPAPPNQPVAMENLYFLWSVERVAMLYSLPTITGKDWYGWGAQLLVKNQHANGSWFSNKFHGSAPMVDTSFALLFLKRLNLVQDLTEELPRFVTIIESGRARK